MLWEVRGVNDGTLDLFEARLAMMGHLEEELASRFTTQFERVEVATKE